MAKNVSIPSAETQLEKFCPRNRYKILNKESLNKFQVNTGVPPPPHCGPELP